MKTIEEAYKEIHTSENLVLALGEIRDKASLEAFLKELGCAATADEFTTYVSAHGEGELDDEIAKAVAGGIFSQPVVRPTPGTVL